MIIDHKLGTLAEIDLSGRKLVTVPIEWFELDKKLLRKTTSDGEEIGIRLEHAHLHEGDVLYADEGKVIAVEVLPCELTAINVTNMREMGRLCFELGNRHLSLAIEDHRVTVPYDEPTFLYLEKLGFDVEVITDKFTHFTVCHGHGHNHS